MSHVQEPWATSTCSCPFQCAIAGMIYPKCRFGVMRHNNALAWLQSPRKMHHQTFSGISCGETSMPDKPAIGAGVDKRRYDRKELLTQAIFVSQHLRLKSAVTIDISTGGLSLIVPEPIKI